MDVTTAPRVNLADWPRLSPLLDELLELPPAEWQPRIAALRATDPQAADGLQWLLQRLDTLDEMGFLHEPALTQPLHRPAAAAQAGQRLGPYVLHSLLGEGGMGQVWLARRADGQYDEEVAVKLMLGGLRGADAVARFRREAQILARLDHPGIVRLRDAGVAEDAAGQPAQPFLVLDLVRGRRIDEYAESALLGAHAVRQRVQLMVDVLDAVSHAHQRGVLHRDLKPANILVTEQGRVRLLDFGIAKLVGSVDIPTSDPTFVTRHAGPYTERYAAPEQVQGGEVTTATDVYAAGVLLYELLTGSHPTSADPQAQPLQRLQALADHVPRPLPEAAARAADPAVRRRARELRGDLSTIVAQALKKRPEERYPQAAALADDLRRWLAHDPISAQRDSAGYRLRRFVRRHRVPVLAASSAGVLMLAAGAGLALWQAAQARAERARAEAVVGTMLGNLKKHLEPLGRLDLMADSSRQALDYYRESKPGGLDADALKRRADALLLIGEMARLNYDNPLALSSFEQAAQTAGLAAQADPGNPQRLLDQALQLYQLSKMSDQRNAYEAGLRYAEQSVALAAQALKLLQPGTAPEAAGQLVWLESRNAQAYQLTQLGLPQEALAILRDAEPRNHALLPRDLRARSTLGSALQQMAIASSLSGDLQGAADAYATCARLLAQWQGQAGEPERSIWERRRQVTALRDLARAQLELGRQAAALAAAREAAAAFQPQNHSGGGGGELMLQEDMVRDRLVLAAVEWAGGTADSAAAARRALQQAEELATRIDATPGERTRWHVRIRGELLITRALLQPGYGSSPAELAELRRYMQGLARFENGDRRLSMPAQLIVAQVQGLLAQRLQAQGQTTEAATHWQQILQRLQPLQNLPTGGPPAAVALRQQANAALRQEQPVSGEAGPAASRPGDRPGDRPADPPGNRPANPPAGRPG